MKKVFPTLVSTILVVLNMGVVSADIGFTNGYWTESFENCMSDQSVGSGAGAFPACAGDLDKQSGDAGCGGTHTYGMITTEANNPDGVVGGRGYARWMGNRQPDPNTNNYMFSSGYIMARFANTIPEVWIRRYVKWTGIGSWSEGKNVYMFGDGTPWPPCAPYWQATYGTDWRIVPGNCGASAGTCSDAGNLCNYINYRDGEWHYLETHYKFTPGSPDDIFIEVWYDGTYGGYINFAPTTKIVNGWDMFYFDQSPREPTSTDNCAANAAIYVDDITIATPSYSGFVLDSQGNPMIGPIQASGQTVCPDSVCNGTETCITCPQDCPRDSDSDTFDSIPCGGTDCDDNNASINPGATEICDNGIDENCDPSDDNCLVCYDNDGDGYYNDTLCSPYDCDDNNSTLNTTITCPWDDSVCGTHSLCLLACPAPPSEICDNGIDDDCDGLQDCSDTADCSSHPSCQVPQPSGNCGDLKLLMHMDNLIDEVSGIDATNNGAIQVTGLYNGAYGFDGSSSYLDIGDTGAHDFPTEDFTISVWIKPEATLGTIISKGGYIDNVAGYVVKVDFSGLLEFEVSDGSTRSILDAGTNPLITDGSTWYHISAVVDRDVGYTVYIDGTYEMSGSVDTTGNDFSSTQSLFIGARNEPSRYFNGVIDDAAIWNRSLTQQEIQDIFISGSPITCQVQAVHRCDNNPQDGCVEEHELIPFIDSWKYNSTDYPMWEMMGAVSLYYSPGAGC